MRACACSRRRSFFFISFYVWASLHVGCCIQAKTTSSRPSSRQSILYIKSRQVDRSLGIDISCELFLVCRTRVVLYPFVGFFASYKVRRRLEEARYNQHCSLRDKFRRYMAGGSKTRIHASLVSTLLLLLPLASAIHRSDFPASFLFGTATSSYQVGFSRSVARFLADDSFSRCRYPAADSWLAGMLDFCRI